MSVDFNGIGRGQVNIQQSPTDKAQARDNGKAAESDASRAQASQPKGENVNLSNQAKSLKQLETKLGDYPEVDDDKVAQIRAALENGTYKVDAEKLAQKMLEMDKSIFG
ncbi:flagellar biosynthesis anti-sigma factor FlgM [Marinobacter sp. C2H3]|uniref:flagellar biosynthesis anti-sigma factor FlgM n=1 Tax=Marinobacter sp. C2H3 TaxID=3119003 RepID=UPI00300F4D99